MKPRGRLTQTAHEKKKQNTRAGVIKCVPAHTVLFCGSATFAEMTSITMAKKEMSENRTILLILMIN